MIIYLKYPRKRGFFWWDELSLVARTLGFHGDLFHQNFPEFIACQREGITTKLLVKLVCDNTYLHTAVDATANFHFFPWNISAIHKTILLLNERLLTFSEIHLVRVAYLFYEGIEAKGLPLDDNILQKTLKLCGRMISPQKMSHRLFLMTPRLQEPGFIQLHEFLDFVLWTELYDPRILREAERLGLAKDGDGCFQMSDFEELLRPVDDRLSSALDGLYEAEECTYSETKSTTRDAWKEDVTESYLNPTFRLIRVPKARSDFVNLTGALNQSRRRMNQSKFGCGNRPNTAPALKVTQGVQKNSSSKIQMVHEHSHLWKINMVQNNSSKDVQMDLPVKKTLIVQEESTRCNRSKRRVMSSRSASVGTRSRRDKAGFTPPKAFAFSKYRIPSVATDEDLQKTSQLIDNLKFDMVMLAARSDH